MSVNTLTPVNNWLEKLATVDEHRRGEFLAEMQKETRAAGGCGSLQTANGLPCRRTPKAGYPVCRKHGERAPQTVAKAERLLAIARMPAIEVLLDQLDQAQEVQCVTCGFPAMSIKYMKHIAQISFKLLDRTGFGPRSTIDLNAKTLGDQQLDVSLLTDEEFTELSGLLDSLNNFKTKVNARLAGNVVRETLAPALGPVVESVAQGADTNEAGSAVSTPASNTDVS